MTNIPNLEEIILSAEYAYSKGDFSEYAKLIDEAERLHGKHPFIYRRLAEITSDYNDYETALELITKSIQLEENNSESHFIKGKILKGLNNIEEAIKSFKKSARGKYEPLVYTFLASCYYAQGDFINAEKTIRTIKNLDRNIPIYRYHAILGYSLVMQNNERKNDEAKKTLLEIEDLRNDSNFYTMLTQACINTQDFEEAEEYARQALIATAIEYPKNIKKFKERKIDFLNVFREAGYIPETLISKNPK